MKRIPWHLTYLCPVFLTPWMTSTSPALEQAPTLKPVPEGRWLSDFPGALALDVKVVGRYAFLAAGRAGLEVIDINNPVVPIRIGGCAAGEATDLAISGNYAYVASGIAGLHVVDIRNPTHCERVGGYASGNWILDVAVSGNYAFLAADHAGLEVIDVSRPAQPVRVGGTYLNGRGWSVAVAGNYAYVAEGDWGMEVIDVSSPSNCVRLGRFSAFDSNFDVAISGHYAYVTAADDPVGLKVFDISNPTLPLRIGSGFTGEDAHAVTVEGIYAYVHTSREGMRVLDVSDPTNCIPLAKFARSGQVAVAEGRIYVAAFDEGLLVVPSLPGLQFAVRVDATPNLPFTLEASSDLEDPTAWQPLVTTNVATMPFVFVDFDVKLPEERHKFYRVRAAVSEP